VPVRSSRLCAMSERIDGQLGWDTVPQSVIGRCGNCGRSQTTESAYRRNGPSLAGNRPVNIGRGGGI
jgi:hypothetical protein